jgi:hypothetical protein
MHLIAAQVPTVLVYEHPSVPQHKTLWMDVAVTDAWGLIWCTLVFI